MSYILNVLKKTAENNTFRTVLYTGKKSQLVIMNIPAGGEIGKEKHVHVEQLLFIMSGKGNVIIDGKENDVAAGDVVVVTPGETHNLVNSSNESLLLYTVYAPANHINGRIHNTKEEAEADAADESFGR